MDDDPALSVLRVIADGLPDELDDETAAKLAARIGPYVEAFRDAADTSREYLLTPTEVARLARVHVETVRRAVRAGRLRAAGRVGRSPRIHPLDVERWIADGLNGNGTIGRRSVRHARWPRPGGERSLKAVFRNARADAQ
jgi:excisionase family DNA binding protein